MEFVFNAIQPFLWLYLGCGPMPLPKANGGNIRDGDATDVP